MIIYETASNNKVQVTLLKTQQLHNELDTRVIKLKLSKV